MSNLEKYHGQVVEQRLANFEMRPESDNETTSNLVAGILRRWRIVLLTFLLLCFVGITAIWLLIKPLYTVTSAVKVAPILTNILSGEKDDYGGRSVYDRFMYTQAEMVTSSRVIQRVADNLVDKDLSFFKSRVPDSLENLQRALKYTKAKPEPASILKAAILDGVITVAPAADSELILVTMKSVEPQEAKVIVDAFVSAYMAIEVSNSTRVEEQELTVLENDRRVRKQKLQSQHEAIRQLAQEYGTTTLAGRQDMMLQRVTTLLAELTKLEARRISLEAQVQLLEQTKEQAIAPEELLKMRSEHVNADPTVQEFTRSIVELEQGLIVAKQTLTPTNPALKQRQDVLDAFKLRLEEQRQEVANSFDALVSEVISKAGKEKLYNARAELEQTKAYEERLRGVLAKEDTQTIELGRKQLQIQDLQFQLTLDKEMYDRVLRRIQELEMERKRPARVSVAYGADVSYIRDKRIKYTVALIFAAMACGMLLAFLRDKADLRLRTPDDVVKRIGIRVIGTTTSPHTVKRALIPRQIVEDYRTIRTNLELLDDGGLPQKLVVTSPGMRDGKTTFAINLATTMCNSGKKVLLIDGDLRKPDIARLLNLPSGSGGLQDLLFGKQFDQLVYQVPSTGLDVLAADSRNVADAYVLLELPQTAHNIDTVSQKYDHVIIDTPPVLSFPDALVWAKIADAVILTSLAGQTTAPDLKEAKEKLAQINVRVLGTVLSNVPVTHTYYRYRYHYYSQDGQRSKKPRQADTKLMLPLQSSGDGSESASS